MSLREIRGILGVDLKIHGHYTSSICQGILTYMGTSRNMYAFYQTFPGNHLGQCTLGTPESSKIRLLEDELVYLEEVTDER